MNLFMRMIWLLLTARGRGPMGVTDEGRVTLRCWPNDLDVNMHMNNGRYLTIMDLGRFDLILRMGLAKAARREGWMPVLSAAKVRFRRELRLFQKFRLETRIVWWSGTHFVMEHRVLARGKGGHESVATVALMLGGLYQRSEKRFVPVEELMKVIGVSAEAPEPAPEVRAFLEAEQALKRAT